MTGREKALVAFAKEVIALDRVYNHKDEVMREMARRAREALNTKSGENK